MITDGLGCASCAKTCGSKVPDSFVDSLKGLGCAAGETYGGYSVIDSIGTRKDICYPAPVANAPAPQTYAQWAAANPVLATQLNPTSFTDPNKCPAGYEWDGLAGLGSLNGCRPNAQTLAAQHAQDLQVALILQQQAQAQQQIAAQQQAASDLAKSRQCQPGYEWDGLDGLRGLSGCRKIVITSGGVPVAATDAPIDLGVQQNWFTTTSFFGLPNWQLVAGVGTLLVIWKEVKG